MTLRIYHDILVKVCTDLARENVIAQVSLEDDQDMLLHVDGPKYVTVAAGGSDQQVSFPTGATKLRFMVVYGVDNPSGIRIHEVSGAASGEQSLVVPPAETDGEGFLLQTVSWDSMYLTNPDSAAEVNAKILLGFAAS